MIKILKLGKNAHLMFKTLECKCCGTIFRCTKADISGTRQGGRTGREIEYDYVKCPVCGENVDFQERCVD